MVIVMTKLVHGIGINDADYQVTGKSKLNKFKCAYHLTWTRMIKRCYSEKWAEKFPTYKNCLVCDEWLTFSNFKRWMENQRWQGKQLDKDIIKIGNKTYSPETCAFVCRITNSFITDRGSCRGELPIGVTLDSRCNKLKAQCGNPFARKVEHLGYFDCSSKAHLAWKKRKHELACQLADLQTDERVANALRTRYI